MKIDSVVSMILGGGRGTRLDPLTRKRSKPAVPIGGKYRLVDIPISNCLHSGVRQIYVLTQFNSASLNRHIKNTYHFDLFSRGFVDILAAEQTPSSTHWYQGTADAVRQTYHHLENTDCEYILILSGDQLYQMDFREMLDKHLENNSDITIATIPVNADDATGFGILKSNKNGAIESFIEKPEKEVLSEWKSEVGKDLKKAGKEYMASMGIYIFNRETMFSLLEQHAEATDFGKEIIPKAIEQNLTVTSYNYTGYWTDIGTIKSFFDANLELTDELPNFDLYDERKNIFTRPRLLPASKLSGTTLEKTIVSEGCIIEASRIEHTLVGIRSRIGKGTTIRNSIIMGNDFYPSFEELANGADKPPVGIGRRCYIEQAIIDKNCRIGNDVRITGGSHLQDGDFGQYCVVDGIVIVPKGSVITDGTVI